MLIEHLSDAYDVMGLWLYADADYEFVANASWIKFVSTNGPFDGPANRKVVSRVLCAESDTLDELRSWCLAQSEAGAEIIHIYRTWPILESQAPKGHRLHGRRDNSFLEAFVAQRKAA